MRLLLDTQVVLWAQARDPRLGLAATRIIDDADLVFVSIVSLWEVVIKVRRGKLKVAADAFLPTAIAAGCKRLDLTAEHVLRMLTLPDLAEHRDPFDLLLLAQALSDALTVVSADRKFVLYPQVRWIDATA